MPAATHSYTIEALKGQAVTKQLHDTVTEIQNRIGARLFEKTARYTGEHGTEVPDFSSLMSDEDKILLKRRVLALKRNSLPPVVTHNMADDSTDPILNQIRRVQLFNRKSDRVKVIFHPEFLNSNNPILGLDYEEFVRGCHLGVFASYYEPVSLGLYDWKTLCNVLTTHLSSSISGDTLLQSAQSWAFPPSLPTCLDLGWVPFSHTLVRSEKLMLAFRARFCSLPFLPLALQCWLDELIENSEDYGIYITDRRTKSVEDSVNQLTDQMFSFSSKTRRQRINQRNRTERLSELLDWKRLGLEYSKARQLALRRAYPDSFEGDDFDFSAGTGRLPPPSAPGSPRLRSGMMTPGDIGTL